MTPEQVKLLTDQQLWRWFNDRHSAIAERMYQGEDVTEEIKALRLEEKIQWKLRKNNVEPPIL